ncbi:hypothetical protein KC349_g8052 [Hortaea werneckii]|nr:hypothetical protein KC349_g8052 [Hortaea werneckii]
MPRVVISRHVITALRRASTTAPRFRRPETNTPLPIDPSQPVAEEAPPNLNEARIARARKLPLLGASVFAVSLGFYCLQLVIAARQPCTNSKVADLAEQKDVVSRYDYTADSFDSEVGLSEFLMGLNGTRKALSQKCQGNVLEVSCGTGRNLGYYDIEREDSRRPAGKVNSLTFIDISPQMVEVCKKKWMALFGSKISTLKPDLSVRFLTGSALGNMPLAPNGKKYDTIIQTMGMCSTPTPVALVANMVKHLDTSNPDARIYLLEHGRSYMPWVNNILDGSAEKHAELHGCWFNREIGSLVQEAADQTGLEVAVERRHHFGTTWVFELKPKAETVTTQATAPAKASEATGASEGWLAKIGWK